MTSLLIITLFSYLACFDIERVAYIIIIIVTIIIFVEIRLIMIYTQVNYYIIIVIVIITMTIYDNPQYFASSPVRPISPPASPARARGCCGGADVHPIRITQISCAISIPRVGWRGHLSLYTNQRSGGGGRYGGAAFILFNNVKYFILPQMLQIELV